MSLPMLRPLAVLCLAVGLVGLRREEVARFRAPLGLMLALLALVLLHLVPLPPLIWTNLPGRELAAEVADAARIAQPWRPITLVPWRGWNAFFAMLVPAAVMVLAARCRIEQHRLLVLLLLTFGALTLLLAVFQTISGFNRNLYLYAISSVGTPTGLFANRNHQAAFLCCLLPLLAVFATPSRKKPHPVRAWVGAFTGAVALLVLLATGSRAGLFLGLVSLCCVALFYRYSRGAAAAKRRVAFIALGVVAVLAITTIVIILSRAEAIDRMLNTGGSEESRFEKWAPIPSLIQTYLPFGSGIGSFVEVYKAAEPRELLGTSYFNHAHSDWMEWMLEGGAPAILLMLAAAILWGRRSVLLFRKLREGREGREHARLGFAGASIILVLGLASLVDYPLRVPSLMCLTAVAAIWMSFREPNFSGPFDRAERAPAEVARGLSG